MCIYRYLFIHIYIYTYMQMYILPYNFTLLITTHEPPRTTEVHDSRVVIARALRMATILLVPPKRSQGSTTTLNPKPETLNSPEP